MSRFQAQTSAVIDEELSELREQLGLRDDQKAVLLSEVTSLAAWVVRQTLAGRAIEARGDDGVVRLDHPALDRLQRRADRVPSVLLTDAEAARLAELMDQPFAPPPALRTLLERLADPTRQAPEIRWP